jgi:hypothetical protein
VGSARQWVRDAVKGTPRPGVLIVLGQVSMFVFLAISVALHPGFVFKVNEGGISNYGVHLKTAISYSLAFLLCSYFSYRAARLYRPPDVTTRRLRLLLYAYSGLLLLTLLSTYGYKLDVGLKDAHIGVGVVLITFELLASVWIYTQLGGLWDTAFIVVQLGGFVLAALTFFGALHVLFLGQALADVGFALLLIHMGLATPCPAYEPPPVREIDGRA